MKSYEENLEMFFEKTVSKEWSRHLLSHFLTCLASGRKANFCAQLLTDPPIGEEEILTGLKRLVKIGITGQEICDFLLSTGYEPWKEKFIHLFQDAGMNFSEVQLPQPDCRWVSESFPSEKKYFWTERDFEPRHRLVYHDPECPSCRGTLEWPPAWWPK